MSPNTTPIHASAAGAQARAAAVGCAVSIFAVALMPAVGKAISNASAFYGTII
jgi:hypothetical protein